MKIINLVYFISLFFLFAQCDESITANNSGEPWTLPPTSDPSIIVQIADTIKGEQGQTAKFNLSDYFDSESDITSADFFSDTITIEVIGDSTFELSQPDTLSGEYTISGILINDEADTLEAELIYDIAANDSSEGGDHSNGDGGNDSDNGNNGDDGDDGDDDNDNRDTGDHDSTLVIMPLGDSITNDGRSRIRLWNLLVDDGYAIDYVGDQEQRTHIPDPDHEGVGGITIQGVVDKAESLMQRHEPEYVFLMIGTNDIAWYFDETGEEIAKRWNDLVQIIIDNSPPETYIIAATIPPVTSKNNGKDGMPEQDRAVIVKDYNKAMRNHIRNRIDAGDNIILADVEDALNLENHVSGDGVHLNEAGYILMGEVYYEALISIIE